MNSQKRMELVIDGAPARRLGSALAEVWVFRGTIRAFAERDIRVKYSKPRSASPGGDPAAGVRRDHHP
jgi:hypothetical protein